MGDHTNDAEGFGFTQTKSVIVILWLHPTASVIIFPMSSHELPVKISLSVLPLPAGLPFTYQTQLLPKGFEVFVKVTERGEQPSVALAAKLGCGKAFTIT
jgi:hypothetical protein